MDNILKEEVSRNFIFGAKATAAGLYRALCTLHSGIRLDAFLVSKQDGNPSEIWRCPVRELREVSEALTAEEKADTRVFVAVPELIHSEIKALLQQNGFQDLVMIDSRLEAKIMGEYYAHDGVFQSVHDLTIDREVTVPAVTVYLASFFKDKPIANPPKFPAYYKSLFLGCEGALQAGIDIAGRADYYDNAGDNISGKNSLRCEMTAHYWIWKNRLLTEDEYVGVYHYRRTLDLSEEDLKRIKSNDVDVVLPYPMLHYPNAGIHHTWYVKEQDWGLTRQVVNELYPEYGAKWDDVFATPAFYNYNMLLAKKSVFADYCKWLYPILDRIEEMSEPKGADRADRYTAYLSESLETLYFMVNRERLKIYHTGRLLYC